MKVGDKVRVLPHADTQSASDGENKVGDVLTVERIVEDVPHPIYTSVYGKICWAADELEVL